MIDEEDTYRDMLESKRFDIVQNLQVERTFVFDYLRNKSVLDGEDCELIRSEKTTSLQIGKFVDILSRKGPEAYNCLLESLQLENPTLYKKLTGEEACPSKCIFDKIFETATYNQFNTGIYGQFNHNEPIR